MRSTILWILTILFTLSIAVYQRMTGPTYPVRGSSVIDGTDIKYRLLRTYTTGENAPVEIETGNDQIKGYIEYRRYKSFDDWHRQTMTAVNGVLRAELPDQPPAGKVMYKVFLGVNPEDMQSLTSDSVILRYKGAVPAAVLIPHILLMFLAMLFSSRTGLEALLKGPKLVSLTTFTLLFLLVGGMILGPVVQKFAFGAFWTGWPIGHDLTDNKTLVAFAMWVIAAWRVRRNPNERWWVVAAAVILLAVYIIPHSVLGSEIDYTQLPAEN